MSNKTENADSSKPQKEFPTKRKFDPSNHTHQLVIDIESSETPTKKQKTSSFFYELKKFEFNEVQIYEVIAALRFRNDARDNCTHLAKDLIEFFQTGIMPTQPSKTDPSSLKDFSMTVIIEPIKREKGSDYEIVTHSVVNRSDVMMPYIPCNQEYPQKDGVYHLEDECILNVDKYTQSPIHYTDLNKTLQIYATKERDGISVGYINLGHCGNYVELPCHMIVYYATKDVVKYMDCHLYNGLKPNDSKNKKCIFSNVSDIYHFGDKDRLGVNMFSPIVFYIPISIKRLQDDNIYSIKQE